MPVYGTCLSSDQGEQQFQQRQYTGAIAPAFGENVVTHDCGCGAMRPQSDGESGRVSIVLIGIVAGIAAALLTRGGR